MRKWTVFFAGLLLFTLLFGGAREGQAQKPASLKALLFYDVGGKDDSGFARLAHAGLEKAVMELGVQAVYVEHSRQLERDQALWQAAASDAGMIIGVGFGFSDKFNQLAVKHPDKKFVCVDYSAKVDDQGRVVAPPGNLAGLTFREEEGSYLVGVIAALTSKTGKIGFVGGMNSPVIGRFEAGYVTGAKAVRPDIRIFSRYAGITGRAFNDPAKGYRLAMRMYRDGADVVYHASGATGAGVFRAAKKMKRLAVGVDVDESAQAPGRVLTSMTKNIDVAIFNTVKSWVDGTFSGGIKSFGLREKGVGFVFNEQNKNLLSAGVRDQALALQERIVAGEVKVPAAAERPAQFSRADLQDLLASLKKEVAASLYKLDGDLKKRARLLDGKALTGPDAHQALQTLYAENPFIIDCETVSNRGIMVVVEPPAHQSSEGADISKQAHMIKLFKTHRPVLSGSFKSVEGPQAVVIHHPVFSADRRFAGSIASLFAPEYLLAGIVGPVAANLPVEVFLMQTDGLIIYDVDTQQIGRNALTDPLYQPFPEVTALARKMIVAAEGKDAYSFYRQVGKEKVSKVIYWKTIILHGTAWRLGMTCAAENLAKD